MTLVDANLLLFARDEASPFHPAARSWLAAQLGGPHRVAIPWQSLAAFLRVSTTALVAGAPLSADEAWEQVAAWLAPDVVWTPVPGPRHAELLGRIIRRHQVRGRLMPDAIVAALALEHGLTVFSADTDFARFDEVRWINPLAPA